MTERTDRSGSTPLPDAPSLEWLRKRAKHRLSELRASNPSAKLADAQLDVARSHGFASWRALKAHVDSLTIDGQLIDAARTGDDARLTALLDAHPDKLHLTVPPYDGTLLHTGARHLGVVDALLRRGFDPNARERGDNTYAMHWAAAGGELDVVRRLADAGGDVIGAGDDHELEVIGWASCWDGCDDDAHRAVADFLVSRGAKHHIFSAVALELEDEVRRIVAADPSALNRRMSRNENHQTPLHFAVRMRRPTMVALLLALGADPLAVDGTGFPAAMYARTPDVDRPIMQAIHAMTLAELRSATRGNRASRALAMDLVAAVSLGDWEIAARLIHDDPGLLSQGGALHLMAKRGDLRALQWLLDHGADPNARWAHWDATVTPLHMAAFGDHPEIVRPLIEAGADPTIRDDKHDADARGWAEFFRHRDVVRDIDRWAPRPP